MNAKQTGSVIVAVVGALIFGAALSAFRTVGPDAITAGGDFNLTQIVNVLGMLLGGGMTITGGGLLAWIKGKIPEQLHSGLDELAARLQKGKPVSGEFLATAGMLQTLKHGPFKGNAEATPHLDELMRLAWDLDNEVSLAANAGGNRKAV